MQIKPRSNNNKKEATSGIKKNIRDQLKTERLEEPEKPSRAEKAR